MNDQIKRRVPKPRMRFKRARSGREWGWTATYNGMRANSSDAKVAYRMIMEMIERAK